MSLLANGVEVPPVASQLMQSLRSIGYTTDAAIADIVDNSIGAEARRIEIAFAHTPEAFVTVLDDGRGMTAPNLVAAMQYGSRDPRAERTGADLGRFGLGLKTASLSQCRRLTVASKRDGEISLGVWDVDECEQRGCWWLGTPSSDVLPPEILTKLEARESGTAVIWQQLDRLLGSGSGQAKRNLDEVLTSAGDHLALTFHRFLTGEVGSGLTITLNGRPLPAYDPFLVGHVRGQALHAEQFPVEGHTVTVSPFVLPLPSRLKAAELDRAGGHERLKTGHGFYIYRGGRLVVPGGWFRIVPSDDLIRLARIRVDVPVSLDHLWKVDVRKAVAEPPAVLRPHLKRIVGQTALRARRVYTHKGTPAHDDGQVPIWRRQDGRDGFASWKLNRDHPFVSTALRDGATPGDVKQLFDMAERLLPLHDIHIHLSNDLPVEEAVVSGELETVALQLLAAFDDLPEQRQKLLDTLHLIEPFNREPETARALAQRLKS